jgi:hypothetical protein
MADASAIDTVSPLSMIHFLIIANDGGLMG